MRTSILISAACALTGLTLAACSGATAEPVDQSAQAETARLSAPPVEASAKSADAAPGRGHRGPPDPAALIKRFDQNGDGLLQANELPDHMKKFLGQADTNGDGVISLDELTANEAKLHAAHLAMVDTNHDGQISPEERKAAFEQFAQKRFAKLDKNNDGALTAEEVGPKRWAHLSVADADKNGSITEQEIMAAVASGSLKFPHRGHGKGGAEREPSPAGAAPAPPAASSGT
jgi:Ca2+-binding EF-hand superfamily protein